MSRNRKPTRTPAPRVEGLEDRSVPAGDVAAFASGGALYLYGDGLGNQIYVSPADGDNVSLTSLDGTTTINGQAGPVVLGEVTERVEAHLGGGDDVLTMFQVHPHRALIIDTGDGDDLVTLVDVTCVHGTTITTGAGNDSVRLFGGELSRDSTVDLGAGNDRVSVFETMFRRNPVFLGGGGLDAAAGVNPQFRDTPTVDGFEAVYGSFIPLAVPDAASVGQGGAVQIAVLANDAAFGDALDPTGVVITRQPSAGSVAVNADGTVTYTNDGSGAASDSFSYVVRGTGGAFSNEATVTVSVSGTPTSPPVTPPPPPTTGTGPVPVVSSAAAAVTNQSPIPFTVTFDVNVTGFTQSDVAVTNGTVSGFTAVNARTFTVNVTPAGQGAVTLSVPANVATDGSGANNRASNTLTRTFDSAPPAVTANSLTTNDSTPTLTGTVDDPAATVSVGVGGQTVAATVSGNTWTATVPAALTDGSYPVTVTATDAAGNAGTGTATLAVDTAAPSVAVTTTAGDPIGSGPTRFTATFSEGVTGFDASDLQVTNSATVSNFTAVDARTYTFDVTPTISGLVTVTVPAGAAADAAGNPNTAGSASRTADTSRPSVSIDTTAGDPTNLDPISYTITFSEDVTGFAASDVVLVNGTVAAFTPVDARTYKLDVHPTADGRVTVFVPADVAQDAQGNGNTSDADNRTSDRTAPAPAVSSSADETTATSPIPFTVTFSEDVTGFAAGDVTATNGALSNFTAVDARTYTFDVTPSGAVAVSVSVASGVATDAAGNQNAASNTLTRTYNGPVATPDVTTTATDPTNLAAIPFTVTFSEDVTGFDLSDVTVTNGAASNFQTVDAHTFTFDVAPTADGLVTVTVPAGAATGPGGVPTAAGSKSVTSDRTVPTAAVSSAAAPATHTSPIPFAVTFGEVVSFTQGGLSVTNGTVSNFAQNGTVYTFDVTPGVEGDVIVSVNAGAAQDAAGNANPAPAPLTVLFDTTAPAAPVITGLDPAGDTGAQGDGVTSDRTPTVVGTAEPGVSVEVFADAGSGPVSIGTTTADGNGDWRLTPGAPLADGQYALTAAATDAAGNAGGPSNAFALTVDATPPAALVESGNGDVTNQSPVPVVVTFQEPVTGFDLADVTVSNGTASNFQALPGGSTYTFDVTPAAEGPVVVTVGDGAAADLAGNASTAGTLTVTYDTTAPTATVAAANPTNADPIVFTVTFSEAVTDLAAAGLSAAGGTVGTVTRVDDHTFRVDVTPTADGTVTLDVSAAAVTDPAGNDSLTATGSTVSDRTAPVVGVAAVGTTAITGTSSDNLSGVTGVAVSVFDGTNYWDGTGFTSAAEVFLPATTSDNWANWSLDFSTPGTYTVHARATDAAGNQAFATQSVLIGPGA